MSGKQYLKNQLPVILINLLGMLVLALFLIASDNPIQTVLFIFAVWSIVLVLSLLAFYFSRKNLQKNRYVAIFLCIFRHLFVNFNENVC